MTDGSLTGRDHVASIAVRIATDFEARGYLETFSPETVADVVDELGLDVSTRTVRRVLDALANDETGVLEDVSSGGRRLYRLAADVSAPESVVDPAGEPPDDGAAFQVAFDSSVSDMELSPAASSVAEQRSPLSPIEADEPLILHLFADWGVEAEALAAYGRVVRIGIDPTPNFASDAIQADALTPPVRDVFDLAVAHPPCQRWSTLTQLNGDPDDHPDLLDETREVLEDVADDWILENVPQAPLDDPVVLSGRQFGLPGPPFRRAFETSFDVPQPPEQLDLADRTGPFADDDGTLGDWYGDKALWRTIKHVAGDYPAEAIKNNGIPAPYLHYLAYYWLRDRWSSELTARPGREVVET